MSHPVNNDKRLLAMDVKVFEKVLEQLARVTFNDEYLFYLTHLQKTNPHFIHPAISAAIKRHDDEKRINADERKKQQDSTAHWRKLVKYYCGKTVYVSDRCGIREVVIHGPAHNGNAKNKGFIEIRDDAWMRMNLINTWDTSLPRYSTRMVQRSNECFPVRIVDASLIHIENPYKDEPTT